MDQYYLKPTIKIEPLTWQWYAWPYLIPPLPTACNIAERHLKIMQSYIQNPQIHAQAIKDPKLLGGPFIDLGGQKVEEIKELLDQTKLDCKELILLNEPFQEEIGKLSLGFEYAVELFEASTIKQMAKNFKILLQSMSANPNQPISKLQRKFIFNIPEKKKINKGEEQSTIKMS